MSTDKLLNTNRSLYDFIIDNTDTKKSNSVFTFKDVAKPQGCGDIDVDVILGYPEAIELVKKPTIAIDSPSMPDPPMIGLVEEADARIYNIYGIVVGQDLNYGRRMRDRLAERFRVMLRKGALIPIKDYSDPSKPVIDNSWVERCTIDLLKPVTQSAYDRYRFVCTITILGFFQ